MPEINETCSSCFSSIVSFCSNEKTIRGIQVALGVITLVGGLTAAFALVGYLPHGVGLAGGITGAVSFSALAIITVKRCCTSEEYVFEEESDDTSKESVSHQSLISASIENEERSEPQSHYKVYTFREDDIQDVDQRFKKPVRRNLIKEEASDSDEISEVEETNDHFGIFPAEILFHILLFLTPEELARCASVCKLWNNFINDDSLWQALSQKQNISQLITPDSTWAKTCTHYASLFKTIKLSKPRVTILEVDIFENGPLQLRETMLVIGGFARINIWNLSTGECVQTLNGHSHWVVALQLHETTLVSGSWDKTLKVWDLSTGECVHTLIGHSDWVVALQFRGTTLVSGSHDKSIKVWDLLTGDCVKTLEGHSSTPQVFQFRETTLISGSQDETIKIWDLSTGQCLKTLEGHKGIIWALQLQGATLFSGSSDDTIKVWDLLRWECVRRTIKAHSRSVQALQVQGTMLVSAGVNHKIKFWDLSTGECVKTLKGRGYVSALQLQGTTLVSGSCDKTIKVWDFSEKT